MDIGLFLWGSKNMHFHGSALHFIQITWFTYSTSLPTFAGCPNVQFAGFSLYVAL